MSEELDMCPFCRSKASCLQDEIGYHAGCDGASCSCILFGFDTQGEAIKALNIRAQDKELFALRVQNAKLREALKKAIDVAEEFIHDQFDGTSSLHDCLEELKPCHEALDATLATTPEYRPAEQRKKDGWQPIETAPKDGTIVDLWIIGPENELSFYSPYTKKKFGSIFGGRAEGFMWKHKPPNSAAWYPFCDIIAPGYPLSLDVTPTHWRPLPEPPEEAAHAAGIGRT